MHLYKSAIYYVLPQHNIDTAKCADYATFERNSQSKLQENKRKSPSKKTDLKTEVSVIVYLPLLYFNLTQPMRVATYKSFVLTDGNILI